MKFVCTQTCQVRHKSGRTELVKRGEVRSYDDDFKNPYFRAVAEVKPEELDFLTATEDELMNLKWKFEDAAKVIFEKFGVELKREKGTKKSEVVAQILDARYRAVD